MAQGRSAKIISRIKWIRTSRLSIKNYISRTCRVAKPRRRGGEPRRQRAFFSHSEDRVGEWEKNALFNTLDLYWRSSECVVEMKGIETCRVAKPRRRGGGPRRRFGRCRARARACTLASAPATWERGQWLLGATWSHKEVTRPRPTARPKFVPAFPEHCTGHVSYIL